jgi:hypothetical protein
MYHQCAADNTETTMQKCAHTAVSSNVFNVMIASRLPAQLVSRQSGKVANGFSGWWLCNVNGRLNAHLFKYYNFRYRGGAHHLEFAASNGHKVPYACVQFAQHIWPTVHTAELTNTRENPAKVRTSFQIKLREIRPAVIKHNFDVDAFDRSAGTPHKNEKISHYRSPRGLRERYSLHGSIGTLIAGFMR